MDVLNEWGPEGGTMEKITAAADDAEKEKLMRGYLAALKNTDQVVKRWTLDAKYALDHLPKRRGRRAAARLDLSRLGVAGHSMGGVAGAQFCVEDRRCKAALNLDGIPQYGHDDRYADAGAVPDGVFGPRRAAPARATSSTGARHRSTTAST